MTDHIDLRQQLAAFLSGELDEPAANRLQARIDGDPAVAELADQMADMLTELGQVDRLEPPDGYAQRLRAGLQEQTGVRLPPPGPDVRQISAAGAAAATGWARPAPSGPLSSRPGHVDRFPRVGRVLAVAAGIAVLAVASIAVFGGQAQLGSSDQDSAATAEVGDSDADVALEAAGTEDTLGAEFNARDEAATADDAAEGQEDMTENLALQPSAAGAAAAVEEEAMEEPAGADDEPAEAEEGDPPVATEETDADAAAQQTADIDGPSVTGGPAVLDPGRVEDDDSLRTLIGQDPAAQELLGLDAVLLPQLLADYQQRLSLHDPFADGVPAARCVTEVLQQADGGAIPAVTARVDGPYGTGIAFALVSSTNGVILDTVQVVVVDLVDCQPLRTLDVAGE